MRCLSSICGNCDYVIEAKNIKEYGGTMEYPRGFCDKGGFSVYINDWCPSWKKRRNNTILTQLSSALERNSQKELKE